MRHWWMAGLGLAAMGIAHPVMAGVTYYNNPFTWQATQAHRRTMALTAADVLKATEIVTLPANGSQSPGQTLTFLSVDTGLGLDFELHALTVWPFTFRNNITSAFGTNGLTSGEVQVSNGSDWEIRFTGGQPVWAFGFNLLDNESGPASIRVYGADTLLAATFTGISDKDTFVGVVSDLAISRVVVDDDPVDVAFFNGLQIGLIPEPGGMTATGIGIAVIARSRGVRSRRPEPRTALAR